MTAPARSSTTGGEQYAIAALLVVPQLLISFLAGTWWLALFELGDETPKLA